jgi:hypothetical protein
MRCSIWHVCHIYPDVSGYGEQKFTKYLLPCAGNNLPHSVLGSDVVSRQFGLYSRGNSALSRSVRFLVKLEGVRQFACLTTRRYYAGPGVCVAVNETSMVLPHEDAKIVVEPRPAVHQVIFPL